MTEVTVAVEYKDGTRTVYRGEAEGFLDQITMRLVEGPAVPGYDHTEPNSIQFHAALCRAEVWKLGLDTKENWKEPFER